MIQPLGGERTIRVFAHIGPLLEPLLFAPAFVAVGWALVDSRRRARTTEKNND